MVPLWLLWPQRPLTLRAIGEVFTDRYCNLEICRVYGETHNEKNPVIATSNDIRVFNYSTIESKFFNSIAVHRYYRWCEFNAIDINRLYWKNEIEDTVCKETCHHKYPYPNITSYYKTSNSWIYSKCKRPTSELILFIY